MKVQTLSIDRIRVDGDTQARESCQEETVRIYAELMAEGRTFPPLTVFENDNKFWLVDGFHRLEAAKVAGQQVLACEVHQGTLDDARWYACGANADHGLPRSQEDKRRAIRRALLHPNGSGLSDRQIAERVGVSHSTVRSVRADLESTGRIVRLDKRLGSDGRSRSLPQPGMGKPAQRTGLDAESSNHSSTAEPEPEIDFNVEELEAKRPRQNGRMFYDDRRIEKLFGQFVRELDDRENEVGGPKAIYAKVRDGLNTALVGWQELVQLA